MLYHTSLALHGLVRQSRHSNILLIYKDGGDTVIYRDGGDTVIYRDGGDTVIYRDGGDTVI